MKYYIINERRLLELLKKENQLNALECAGVDNWSYYCEARMLYTDGQDISYEEMALEDLKAEFEYMETDYKEDKKPVKTNDLLNLDISEIKGEVVDKIVENFKKSLDDPMLIKVINKEN